MRWCAVIRLLSVPFGLCVADAGRVYHPCNVPKFEAPSFWDDCSISVSRVPYICSLGVRFSHAEALELHRKVFGNQSHLRSCACDHFATRCESLLITGPPQSSLSAGDMTWNVGIIMIQDSYVIPGDATTLSPARYCDTLQGAETASKIVRPARSVELMADFFRRRWSAEPPGCETDVLLLTVDKWVTPRELYVFADRDYVAVEFSDRFKMNYGGAPLSDAVDAFLAAKAVDQAEQLKRLSAFLDRLNDIIRNRRTVYFEGVPQWALALLVFCSVFGLVLAAVGSRVTNSRGMGFNIGGNKGGSSNARKGGINVAQKSWT